VKTLEDTETVTPITQEIGAIIDKWDCIKFKKVSAHQKK
jgi:hypothetical protein